MKAILRSINNFGCKLKQINNLKYNISPKIRSNKFKSISCNGNIVIEDALNKHLKDYKIYGNTKQQLLPDVYTQVDFIESSGTQYIDTGLKSTPNTKFDFEFTSSKEVGADYEQILGSQFGATKDRIYILIGGSNNIQLQFPHDSNNHLYMNNNGTFTSSSSSTSLLLIEQNKKNRIIFDIPNRSLTVNEYTSVSTGTYDLTSSDYNILLFNRNDTIVPTVRLAKGKLYNFKWYESNVLVRDFIPCYRNSDNEVGLYDLVNNVFYTNQGTGVFTYGSIAPTPDAPIEMVSCGDRTKNLFDKEYYNYITAYLSASNIITNSEGATIFYIKCEPNTTYTVSKTKLFTNDRFCLFDTANIPQINDSALSYVGTRSGENISTSLTITTSNNANYLCVFVQASPSRPNTTRNNLAETIQIEKNSTATSYEPYGYKIPVNVRSENLLKPLLKENGDRGIIATYNQQDDKITFSGTASTTFSNIGETIILDEKLPIGTYYLITPNTHSNFRIGVHLIYTDDTYSNFVIYENAKYNSITTSKEIKSYYLYLSSLTKNTIYNEEFKIMLAKSDNVIPYQPHYNKTINIYLDEPLRKIDEYSDYIDFINGKIVRQLGEVVLDGDEEYTKRNNGDGSTTISFNHLSTINAIKNTNINCTHFIRQQVSTDGIEGIWYDNSNNRFYFEISRNRLSSLDAVGFKTWLQSNNVTVDYVLKTPTKEDIELPNIKLIEGKNIITIGTEVQGVFEAEYYSKEIIDISDYKYNLRKVED